jgi:hypothetical protein
MRYGIAIAVPCASSMIDSEWRPQDVSAKADGTAHWFLPREPLPDYPDQWCLVAERHGVVVDVMTVWDHGDFFGGLAERHAGEYDGWEASVEPSAAEWSAGAGLHRDQVRAPAAPFLSGPVRRLLVRGRSRPAACRPQAKS